MNQNAGHGHVYPRPDGVKARCGGPSLCSECARDFAQQQQGIHAPPRYGVERHRPEEPRITQ